MVDLGRQTPATAGKVSPVPKTRAPVALLAAALVATLVASGCQGRAASRVTLRVTNAVSLADSVDPIVVAGLSDGEPATVTATTIDADGEQFRSSATYRADNTGTVDLSQAAPTAGSYRGVAGMGLLWSMRPTSGDTGNYVDFIPPGGQLVHLVVTVHGRVAATASMTRLGRAAGVSRIDVRPARQGVYGELYLPPTGRTAARKPAVLMLGGSEGGVADEFAAGLLASHGYPTLALAYFAEPGLPKHLAKIPLEYFTRAIGLLDKQRGVDPHRIVVSGVSRGSEAALLVGADFPAHVDAVVALVPSNIALSSYGTARTLPAWTLHGHAVPYQTHFGPAADPADAAIAVEDIRGPIFLECGGHDTTWPSCPMAHAISQRLAAHHREAPTLLDYPQGGHGVGEIAPNIAYSQSDLDLQGATLDANFIARADAWPKLLAFLASIH